MLNSFIIVMREGFESFLLVAVILAYLRKSEQKWLNTPVYVAIALALSASAGLAYLLEAGVDEATVQNVFGTFIGGYVSQFFANEALREAILGAIAVVMVGTLVIHMWRTGPKIQQRMRERLSAVSSNSSRLSSEVARKHLNSRRRHRGHGVGRLPVHLSDDHTRGNGNSIDADASKESKPDQWSTARTCRGNCVCIMLGALRSSHQRATLLPGHRNFSAALHASGQHLLIPRVCRSRPVAK